MSGPSPEAVEMLFLEAIELSPDERASFLDEQFAGDAELRTAVDELLRFDAKALNAPDFLQSPAAAVRAARRLAESAPTSFGRYNILRLHGEGGMGTVYEAEQDNPRRSVALKVIRPGLVSAEIVKRFRDEAQILARLNHPGIAQVYESGMTEDGRPFFAMEFIRGVPLDEYGRADNLDAAARLELLARVSEAVQHAHHKGVIHRDLKPGNILVDESGQPKVLDFGVAHVTEADLLTVSSRTQAGQLLGTLTYMSPEQIAADPAELDGRSDVYTLGVILFELLANRLPYHLDELPVHEVARVIQQEEPSRLGSINTFYRGDVEIIVAKALEKDKSAALCLRGRLGVGHQALPAGRSDSGPAGLGALSASQVCPAQQGARRRRVRHYRGARCRNDRFDLFCVACPRERSPCARENAHMANERERDATYQSYRARIAAAARPSRITTSRCRPSSRRSPRGFARLGMATPAHPARR